jgi:hypothetical protein
MSFPQEFNEWLSCSLRAPVTDEVLAFSFNLFEPALVDGVTFSVELVGSEAFDPKNSDWACEEVWSAQPRNLHIPLSFSGSTWEDCLLKMKDLLLFVLEEQNEISKILKTRQAIALGFVDGDLEIVWSA